MDTRREAREIRRWKALSFAISDMLQASRGARFILDRWDNSATNVRRVLETGTVVCYARPYTRSEAGFQLHPKRDGPADAEDLRLHLHLLDRRDDLYAHNDDTPARRLFDVAEDVTDREVIVTQDHGLWESFDELAAEDFARIARLADELIGRFEREQSEVAARLRSVLSD